MSDVSDRPRFAIGHISLAAVDTHTLAAFYTEIGMRLVVDLDHIAIVELRGGTHIVLHSGRAGQGSLDLIVDNVDETRDVLSAAGAEVSEIQRGNPHDRFDATDPEGNKLIIRSDHAIGIV